jgi:hypothetical protein
LGYGDTTPCSGHTASNADFSDILHEALSCPDDDCTITLTDDITHTNTIAISFKSITFDLDGHTLDLTVSAPGSAALRVVNGGTVNTVGGGKFNITGYASGIDADDNATVTIHGDVSSDSISSTGIRAKNATVTVYGDVSGDASEVETATATGVGAQDNSTVTVHGDVSGKTTGVSAYDSEVTVRGDVFGGFRGVGAFDGSTVKVYGVVSAKNWGISAGGGSTVTVYDGGVISEDYGLTASGGATVIINGDVSGGTMGIDVFEAEITVNGDVYGIIYAESDTALTVNGDIYDGVVAENATVTIRGNVYGEGFGVAAFDGSLVTVDGEIITDGVYIGIGDEVKTKEDGIPSAAKPGYLEYTDPSDPSIVWVKSFISPPTGIADIRGATAAMVVLLLISAVLWGRILRRRLMAGKKG